MALDGPRINQSNRGDLSCGVRHWGNLGTHSILSSGHIHAMT